MISTGFNWFVTNGPWPHADTICPCPTSWQLINRYPFTQQLVCLLILQKWIIFQQKCGSGRLKIVISHYIKISKTNRSIVVNDVLFKGFISIRRSFPLKIRCLWPHRGRLGGTTDINTAHTESKESDGWWERTADRVWKMQKMQNDTVQLAWTAR